MSEDGSEYAAQTTQKLEVVAEEIKGIVYYIDTYNNVYKTEDILKEKENPQIIAHWEKPDDKYTLPEFGLV
jgi:GH25 family lysozyme M1 (1,4-beta-N-acetylmuramidase)